jgi:hypothetical protein
MNQCSHHRSLRGVAGTAACGLLIGLCAVLAAVQLGGVARRVQSWQRRQEPVPAFGQSDLVYFSEPTCPACRIASPTILDLQRRYPHYRIARVDTSAPAGTALQEEYNRAYKVPVADRNRIPAVFAGRRCFIGSTAIVTDLPAYLRGTPLTRPHR